ncbi:hypothetical protein KJ652_04475 [Patescibacteria group bacterium]|nr:hypothetical protein [Patescibacteria group bacterium]MBU1123822.1 hypothetical protein [Patescibacteria group bacterium]
MLHRFKHIVGIILILGLLSFGGLHIFYYKHTSPSELAKKLVEHNRNAEDCFLLRTFDFGPRPTTYEMQMRCVYEYASLTKDPSACELLLPSSYGWSCLGATVEDMPCVFYGTRANPKIKGNGINVNFSECLNKESLANSNACCSIAKIRYTDKNNSCDHLSNVKGDMLNQCHYELAIKKGNIEECKLINNENIRTGCEISMKYK